MFELFTAPFKMANGYEGAGRCELTGVESAACFRLSSCALTVTCESCKAEGYVELGAESAPCPSCAASLVHSCRGAGEVTVSAEAIAKGLCLISKDTEYGLITAQTLVDGKTLKLRPHQFMDDPELLPVVERYKIFEKTLATTRLKALLSCPDLVYWNCGTWQFLRLEPMVYRGTWSREDFVRHAQDDAEAVFAELVRDNTPDPAYFKWETLDDIFQLHVFACHHTDRLKGVVDYT